MLNNKIKDILVKFIKKKTIIFETIKIIFGWYYYKKLNKKNSLKIIMVRGATGDVYLQFLLLKSYLQLKKINNYFIVSDANSIKQFRIIFNISDIKILSTSICNCIEKYVLFSNFKNTNIIFPFYWTDSFQFNRCRVRFSNKFNFMENYFWFPLNIDVCKSNSVLSFLNNIELIEYIARQKGIIKNKTILISPEANSVTGLPIWFWNSLINNLIDKGYYIFMNCNGYTFYRAPNLFLTYSEIVPLLDYAGGFIGVRSGLCDVISTSKCKKVILYPKVKSKFNYSYHRSDVKYSGLEVMGLSDGNNLYEISTLLLKNITDENYQIDSSDEYFSELIKLRNAILDVF